jgi:hypothetical protein
VGSSVYTSLKTESTSDAINTCKVMVLGHETLYFMDTYQRFRRTCCIHLLARRCKFLLNMKLLGVKLRSQFQLFHSLGYSWEEW